MRNLGEFIVDEFAKDAKVMVGEKSRGVSVKNVHGCGVVGTIVNLEKDNSLMRPEGKYFTYETNDFSQKALNFITRRLSMNISSLFPKDTQSVLILGMGNAEIISDALGVKTIAYIDVLKLMEKTGKQVAKFSPSVFSVSGLESFDVIQGIVAKIHPDVIIVVDSLCTKNISRIGRSFQVSNAGIIPGSAVGSNVCDLSKESIGTTVISVGVPVVVYLHSVVEEILGIIKPSNNINLRALKQNFNEIDGIFSPKDIDFIIDFSAELVSRAIINAIKSI